VSAVSAYPNAKSIMPRALCSAHHVLYRKLKNLAVQVREAAMVADICLHLQLHRIGYTTVSAERGQRS